MSAIVTRTRAAVVLPRLPRRRYLRWVMAVTVRFMLFVALVAALTVALIVRAGSPTRPAAPLPAGHATVSRVIDGDTVDLDFGAGAVRARLLGIDTPETVDERRPVQCYGPEASVRLHELLPPGTEVRLERDLEPRDRYQRLLVYAYRVGDGLFVNAELVAGGYATTLSIAPNRAHATELEVARAQAEREHRGLWGACGAFGVVQPEAPR